MDTFDEDLVDGGTMEFEEGDLVEVEDGDEAPLGEEEEEVEEDDDKMEDEDNEEDESDEEAEDEFSAHVVDQSCASFSMHGDCVYASAIHPSKQGVVITGGGDDRAMIWTYRVVEASGEGEVEDDAAQGGRNIVQSIELGGHTDTGTFVVYPLLHHMTSHALHFTPV